MNSVASKLFEKIIEKFSCCKSEQQAGIFTKRLMLNKSANIYSSAYQYSVGCLLHKLLYSKIHNIGFTLIQDAFPMFLVEADKALCGTKQMSTSVFNDLYGDYSKEELMPLKVVLWSWITELIDFIDEINVLVRETDEGVWKINDELVNIFVGLPNDSIKQMTEDELKEYIINKGYPEVTAFQLTELYKLVCKNDELVDAVFRSTEPVIRNINIPLNIRIEGARIQTLLNGSVFVNKELIQKY